MGRYKDEVNKLMDKQIDKGVSKYGQVLEDNPRSVIKALEYQSEELVDALFYAREAIEKVKKMERVVEAAKDRLQGSNCNKCPGDKDMDFCFHPGLMFDRPCPSAKLKQALAELEETECTTK